MGYAAHRIFMVLVIVAVVAVMVVAEWNELVVMIQLLKFKIQFVGVMEERYSILQRKSSTLFKARSKNSQKAVIIKKVSFSSVSPKKKEHIVNEVNTLIHMDYIHILRYLDFEINRKDYTVDIVMEFCQGGTLHDLIAKSKAENKRIEQNQVWKVFYQLAQAIDYIHRNGIIHRNINPSNIYFREIQRKNIKMGGFSLSKKIDFQENLESTVLPNTHYLSPEQIQTGICTKQTDIWSLGCLIYQLCTLQSPFKHPNEFERVKLIKEARLKKINNYSLELNRLIFWCLSKAPQDRPTLSAILDAPEINMRIRERRYQQKQAQLLAKQQYFNKKEKELMDLENQLLEMQKLKRYQSLKKKSSDIEPSKRKSREMEPLLKKSGETKKVRI